MITFNKITAVFLFLFLFSCQDKDSILSDINEKDLFDKGSFNSLSEGNKEKYLDSVIVLLKSKKNDSMTRNLYLRVASEYYYINNINKSLKISFKSLDLSNQAEDSIRKAKALYFVGDCYESSKNDSAYFYYLQAQKLYTKISDYDNIARMLFNKAYILFYHGNYVECEIEISKALNYLKKSKNHRLIYSCNTLMGNCLEKLTNYNEAMKYHKLALLELKKMKTNNNDKDEINNYNVTSTINICNLYDLKGEYSESVKELQGLLSDNLKKKWIGLYAKVLSNLAYSKMKNKDYENVESMLLESLKIVDSIGIESDILYKNIYLGKYYLLQKDTAKSIQNLKEANRVAFKIKSSNEILTSLKMLSEADKNNSLFYLNKYIKISDSINTVQKNAQNKYARIEYETSKIEDENKVLTKSNFYILITSFVLILLLLVIIVTRYLKYKNKELQFIKNKKTANEEIYDLITKQHEKISVAKDNEKARIAKELHDGIMNKIYGVRMNLGFFNSKSDIESVEKRKFYITALQDIESEIRAISHDLSRTSFFDDNDFNILLKSLVENQKGISSTEFIYVYSEKIDWKSFQNIFKINLYRIIQEAILNVNKYAFAKTCEIKVILEHENILKLSIVDDGNGFDVKSARNGIGLRNINDRVNSLNGKIIIESKIGNGTQIFITFDLNKVP